MIKKVENRKVTTLKNGIRVLCITKPNFKTSSIRIKIFAGSLHEEIPGVAHFFEHICFQGTKDFPTQKLLNDYSDQNAIYKNASTSQTETIFSVDGPDLEPVMHIATQLAFHPLLTEASLEKERDAVIDEVRADQFSPGIKAKQKQWAVLGGKRFSNLITGTIDEITKITHDQLIEFHREQYRPNNTLVVICSDKPVEMQVELLNNFIDYTAHSEDSKAKKLNLDWLKSKKRISLVKNELDIQSQSNITLNYDINAPKNYREYLLEVNATNVLSQAAHRHLRENLVLAYGASAYVNYLENRNFGISEEFQSFALYTSVAGNLVQNVIEELKRVPELAQNDTELIQNKINSSRYSGALDQEANAISTANTAVRSAQVHYDSEYVPSKFVEIVQSFNVIDVQKEINKLTKKLQLIQVTSPSSQLIKELQRTHFL